MHINEDIYKKLLELYRIAYKYNEYRRTDHKDQIQSKGIDQNHKDFTNLMNEIQTDIRTYLLKDKIQG